MVHDTVMQQNTRIILRCRTHSGDHLSVYWLVGVHRRLRGQVSIVPAFLAGGKERKNTTAKKKTKTAGITFSVEVKKEQVKNNGQIVK